MSDPHETSALDRLLRSPYSGEHQDSAALAESLSELLEEDRSVSSREFVLGTKVLAVVLDAMAEGVIVCDRRNKIVRVNLAVCSFLGLARADIEGKGIEEIGASPGLMVALQDTVSQGRVTRQELVVPRRGEHEMHLSVAAAPIKSKGGIEGVVAVLHDITQIRLLERVRRDFVANVSHELRTPLATITGYAETLLSGAVDLDPIAVDFVETIERHAKRLNVMVQDLLVLARLEAQGAQPILGPVKLFHVVSDIMDAVELKADEKGVDLVVEVDDVPPVLGEQRALAQVLRNLVENAIKYTPADGYITIRAIHHEEMKRVWIVVSDTGIGMDSVHLPRIFERFYRVDEGRSRDAGGTGLGLSIAKHMVAAMHGKILVESVVGEGSTFTVELNAAV